MNKKETAINNVELAIKTILVKNGYSNSDISFYDQKASNPYRYLKVGYWRRLDTKAQQDLGRLITAELTDFDDDHGWLFSYIVKKS